MAPHLKLYAVGLAVALGAAALVVPTTTTAQASAPAARTSTRDFVPAALDWGRCKDKALASLKARCAQLAVPLDYADPTGPQISIGVSRVEHTTKKYRGVMLTNPGGPGGEGMWMAGLGQYVPGDAAKSYDWIGVDPRGVGRSRPALTCDGQYTKLGRPTYIPSTDATLQYWLNKTRQYAADCGASAAKGLLDHVKTTDTIADFETLRVALGVERLSYFGYSYGTYLGQVYATLHPDRLDKVILDSNVDPTRVWYQANLDQDLAFDKAIDKFFAWVAKGSKAYHLGTTRKQVSHRYYRLIKQLTKKPMDGVGAADLPDVMLGAGYNVYSWPDAAAALSAMVVKKDGSVARKQFKDANPTGPGADNGYAMYAAVQCSDVAWPTDWATWAADNWRVHQKAPFETWSNAWYNAPCRTWPSTPGTPVAVDGSAFTNKLLLIGEQFDAATPFQGSLLVRSLFPTASLIEGRKGTTHAASLYGVGCVDDRIAKYLATGRTPKRRSGNRADVRCPAVRAPSPGADAALGRVAPRRPAIAPLR